MAFVLGVSYGASGEEPIELRDRGRVRQFAVALDEVFVPVSADGKQSAVRQVARRISRAQICALAADEFRKGETCDLVLYEAGRERSAASRRILTSRMSVEVAPGTDIARLCADADVELLSSPPYAENTHIVACRHAGETLDKVVALTRLPGVRGASPLLKRKFEKRLIPNDPKFSDLWHLRNTGQTGGTAGVDINVESVWDNFTGSNVLIGIVDDSLKVNHPDLAANCNTEIDWDWNGNDDDPSPDSSYDSHGTPCGGLAAAKGNNGVGVCGAAFDATLVGMRLIADYVDDATEAEALAHSNSLIHIKSNSWGPNDDGMTLEAPGSLAMDALRDGTENGRGGLGTIYMWAGGNGRGSDDMANKDGYANSIHTISVTAVGNQGGWSYFSERGCSHVVTAPSNGDTLGLTTTDWDGNYRSDFGGTSGATPIAAGAVALMLQANPGLGWRDVQELLIRTATKIDPTDTDWADNSAGYHFSHKYGAGLLNAANAVAMAQTWTNLPPRQSVAVADTGLTLAIPDNDSVGIDRLLTVTEGNALRVEHVTVKVDIDHTSRGQLEVLLTSPAGTVSRLIEKHGDTSSDYDNWTFTSLHHWGEYAVGTWTVTVKDSASGTTGTLRGLTLTVYGSQTAAPTERPVITSALTVDGTVGDYFFYRITASNYPTAFDASPLPSGLSVQTLNGVISGVPTTAGTNEVTIGAANAIGTNTATLTLTVLPEPPKPPVITSPLSVQAVVNETFAYQIEATENPTNFNATGLPPGLFVDTESGLISGTPTVTGTNQVLISATNDDGTDSDTLTIAVYTSHGTPFNLALDNGALLFATGGDADWSVITNYTHDGHDALRSGAIGHGQETYLETTITGPCVIEFWWATSSEDGFDKLSFSVNGAVKGAVSGELDWRPVSIQIPAGTNVARWTYSKDSNDDTDPHDDTVYLDQVTLIPGALLALADALDHTAHTWTDEGSAKWFAQRVETHDAVDAAVSGWIANGQKTGFQTTVDGPGQLSFYWKVSCEEDPYPPIELYDYLAFTIDGATQAVIAGEVDWEQRSFSVPTGTSHVLSWTYSKDVSYSEGSDSAWVDRVIYVPDGTADGYQTWAAQVFTPAELANQAIAGTGADPDGDGYDNLLEYALDMAPLGSGTNNAPLARIEGAEFAYRYRHDTGKTNLTYSLERTAGLLPAAWQSAATTVVSTEGPVELREHRHATTNHAVIRLKVTETGE